MKMMKQPNQARPTEIETPSAALRERDADKLEISYMLTEATRLLRITFDQRMREFGLTAASARALSHLRREDGLSQIELARRLEVSRMALGQTIDRLERSGHVERRPDPSDRRVWRVHLTKKAKQLLPTLTDVAAEQQALILENIPEPEVEALKKTLRQICQRLREMPIETAPEEDAMPERNVS
jgi:MarR family transcriptional regulator, transcriptional regulator for hemolysin